MKLPVIYDERLRFAIRQLKKCDLPINDDTINSYLLGYVSAIEDAIAQEQYK